MNQLTRLELLPGVHLTAVRTGKFKSSVLGVELLLHMDAATAASNTLVPMILRRGSRIRPDMEQLSAALDQLYGGSIEPVVRKKGETHCVGLLGSFLDDSYAMNQEMILEPAARLLLELLLDPVTVDGGFDPDYTSQEQQNLVAQIHSQINDKRRYASMRVFSEMCSEEPFGVDKLGTEKSVMALTPSALWEHYRWMLEHAPIEFYYCGSKEASKVGEILLSGLEKLPVSGPRVLPDRPVVRSAPEEPREIMERLDVTQGKLSMGLRTGGIDLWSSEYPALLVGNAVFGGTTTSKLFLNVREKLSLCYYASSQLEKAKGLMLISSGIRFDQVEQAKTEILKQLTQCQKGAFTDQELDSARRAMVSACRSILDSPWALEDYWLGQTAAGRIETPEEFCTRIEQVNHDEVAAAMSRLSLDTVYFLNGREV